MSEQIPEVDQAGTQASLHKHPGTNEGVATHVESFVGPNRPRGNGRPGASVLLENDSTKIVSFNFNAGDELREHAAHHPVLIEVRAGAVEFTVQDRTYTLGTGECLHLTPKLRHAVKATVPSVLTVTMLIQPEG